MADRSVTVTLSAKVDGFIAAMGKAQASAKQTADSMVKASQTQPWKDVSSDLLKVGAAATAMVGAVSGAAIQWESDWAGVQKTVDGTTTEMAALEDQLRSMARSMPATHTEIAAVAEAAGALGVAREDVAGFTEVMIQLGETTNLTADNAATQLAQFMNIMGTGADEVDRLGSTLVALGNNGASTEAEIMALSHRLAAVGKQMNLSEADVMGMANAMASVGIEAEAGGTAMTLSLKAIDSAVRAGGAELESFADIAGMSAAEFKRAWADDAAGATASFVEGLGEIQAAGGDVNGILEDLGIKGIRQTDTLLRLANATQAAGAENNLLRDSLEMGAAAFEQNTALADEYGQRVKTAKSRIEIAWNSIKDSAITAGESTLPAVAGIADGISGLASKIGELPPAVHTAGAGLTALAGGGLLAAGGIMKGVTAAAEFNAALHALPARAQGAIGALGRLGVAAGIAAAAIAVANIAGSAYQSNLDQTRISGEQTANALRDLASTGDSVALMQSFSAAQRSTTTDSYAMADAFIKIKTSGGGFLEWAETASSNLVGLTGMIQGSREEFAKFDSALASSDLETSARAFAAAREQIEPYTDSISELTNLFPEYRARLESTAQSMGIYNLSQQEMVDWMSGIEPSAVAAARVLAQLGVAHVDAASSAAEQEAALRAVADAMTATAQAAMVADNAAIAYERSLAAAGEAAAQGGITIDEATGKIDLHSEAGRSASSALINMASAHQQAAQAALEDGESMVEVAELTRIARDEFVAVAQQMGLTADQASALADRYGLIPTEATTDISVTGAEASASQIDMMLGLIETLPTELQTTVKSEWDGAAYDVAMASIADLPPETQALIMSAWDAGGYDSAVASLASLPPEVQAQILSIWNSAGYDAAMAALTAADGRVATTYIDTYQRTFVSVTRQSGSIIGPGGVTAATGGAIFGPGTSTSDSIPAWLSTGEYVIRAEAAQSIGYGLLDYINRWGALPQRGYAAGGQVAPMSRQLAQSRSASPARVDVQGLAHEIARAVGVQRPVQVDVYMDGRQIAAGIRTHDRGLV